MPLLLTLFALARRAFMLMYWFAIATLVAGAVVWLLVVDRDAILPLVLAGVLLVTPGLILLHALKTMRSLRQYAFDIRGSSVNLPRTGSMVLLLRPWYWAAVAVSVLAGFVLLPTAIVAMLLRL